MKSNYLFESGINRFSQSEAEINFQMVPFDEKFNYKLTNKSNPFSDKGAWFGFYMPEKPQLAFFGPNVISQEIPINLAQTTSKISIIINNKEYKPINFFFTENNGKFTITSEILDKNFVMKIKYEMFFVSKEDSLISLSFDVNTKKELKIEILNNLLIHDKVKYKSTNEENNSGDWITYFKNINFQKNKVVFLLEPLIDKEEKEIFEITHDQKIDLIQKPKKEKDVWSIKYKFFSEKIKANSQKKQKLNFYQSFYFNKKTNKLNFDPIEIKKMDEINETTWKNFFIKFQSKKTTEKNILKKAIYTLIGNWLGPNGKIKNNTIIPSRTYSDFIGAYAWDIFKIAHGLCEFYPQLAQQIIDSMFDHQIKKNDSLRPWDYGMIPDCIFYNFSIDRGGKGNNWNERNTKPPLASWSVLKVYKFSKDINWLKKIYPKLVSFQKWWDRTRRAETREYFLSYGATLDWRNDINNKKEVLEAISWESGMDNAPRFDWDRMNIFGKYENQKLVSYVIDQVSVCLNSFYKIELESLNKIRLILNKDKEEIEKDQKLIKELKFNINKFMYSPVDNFYHDIKYNKKKPLVEYGLSIESFLPLYSKVAEKQKAIKCIKTLNKNNFLTPFPFPTVAKNNSRFDPTNYWRGPVWISFLYFSILGIYNYDRKTGIKLRNQVIKILNTKEHINSTLRENYHPLSKKGLSTTNFSWTASLLISMITETKGV